MFWYLILNLAAVASLAFGSAWPALLAMVALICYALRC
jgi:hypothetical protein